MRRLAFIFALLSISTIAAGEMTVSLPLEGYYKPGKYMPVRLTGTLDGEVVIRGEGVLTTRIASPATQVDMITSVLVLQAPIANLTVNAKPIASDFRVPEPKQKLVGSYLDDFAAAELLFPGAQIVPIRLNPNDREREVRLPWEALDAIIADAAMIEKWDPRKVMQLVGQGTAIIVRQSPPHSEHWDWQPLGQWWVLHHEPSGPTALVDPRAYEPIASWKPGWGRDFRTQLLFRAILFAILAIGVALWRGQRSILAMSLLIVLIIAGVRFWKVRQPTLSSAFGDITILKPPVQQHDGWTYLTSVATMPDRFDSEFYRPVFASSNHVEQLQMELRCYEHGGRAHYSYQLAKGSYVAFRSRRAMWNTPAAQSTAPVTSPLATLIDQYLGPDDRVIGEVRAPDDPSDQNERWPRIYIAAD